MRRVHRHVAYGLCALLGTVLLCGCVAGYRPMSDWTAEGLARIELQAEGRHAAVADAGEMERLVGALAAVVVVGEAADGGGAEFSGVRVQYTLVYADGAEKTLAIHDPLLYIDGTAYQTKAASLVQLHEMAAEWLAAPPNAPPAPQNLVWRQDVFCGCPACGFAQGDKGWRRKKQNTLPGFGRVFCFYIGEYTNNSAKKSNNLHIYLKYSHRVKIG